MEGKLLKLEFMDKRFRPGWLEDDAEILFKNIRSVAGIPLVSGVDASGNVYPLVARTRGKLYCGFSFDEQLQFLLNQEYVAKKKPLTAYLPFHYHKTPFRIAMNKWMVGGKMKNVQRAFPHWPKENAADILTHMQRIVLRAATFSWPFGRKYAVWLTHDVDTGSGLKMLPEFLQVEESFGLRSSNFIVGNYYRLDENILRRLQEGEHEIGCHGDNHDTKLPYLPREKIRKRMEGCAGFLKAYNVEGFRAPSLLMSEELDEVVEERFAYDSSITDTELIMPDSDYSGCCSVFPFYKRNLLKIPITMPMDSSLIFLGYTPHEILKLWLEKLAYIKKIGGIATMVTHSEKHFSANPEMFAMYKLLLQRIAADKDTWVATGKEVFQHLKKNQHVPNVY